MKTAKREINSKSKGHREKNHLRNAVRISLILIITVAIFPLTASASKQRFERFVLDFDDTRLQSMQSEPAKIFLKKSLRDQYPGIDLRALQLEKVVLVAKTKLGRGGAELRVGEHWSGISRVYGNPWEFHGPSRYSFDKVRFVNPANGSAGPWQLDLWGNFVVRKVVVIVSHVRRPHNNNFDDRSGRHRGR